MCIFEYYCGPIRYICTYETFQLLACIINVRYIFVLY